MILSSLSLQNFRNFKKSSFDFSPKATIIIAPNARGKTNILEAIYMLVTGKSFRADLEKEVISYGEELARLGAEVSHGEALRSGTKFFVAADRVEGSTLITSSKKFAPSPRPPEFNKLEIVITAGQVGSKKVPKKKFLVNGVSKRSTNFIGNFFAVLFSPQDLRLITDSPSLRRRYLNTVLSSVDKQYRIALLIYEKALRQRNKVLERIRERQASVSQLDYWDKLLINNGQIITQKREEFIDFINSQYCVCHPELDSGSIEIPKRVWNDTKVVVSDKEIFESFKVAYEKNEISEDRLEEKREKEVLLGVTLVGPHRDDFIIKLKTQNVKLVPPAKPLATHGKTTSQMSNLGKSRDLSIYGSRGEQRLAVLWLKLSELAFIEEKTSQKPVLLLDDIFSELDADHRDLVTQIIPHQQTIITTTEEGIVKGYFLKGAKIIKLEI